jgi:AraC family transcriptional activator FtrA
MRPKNWRKVVAVAYEGLSLFEFGIVVEVFGLPRPEVGKPWYEFEVCSAERKPLRALAGGVSVQARSGLSALRKAGTIVLSGWNTDRPVPPALIRELQLAHARGARLISICSGAFALAIAGLLDGKRATTHWRYAEKFAARFPKIKLVPDVLYVDEGSVLTSAGSAAGIDLCLHVVRHDYGAEIANRVARRMVTPPHREGGQAQYVQSPVPAATNCGLAPVLDWARSNLEKTIYAEDLARKAMMSSRTFARQFVRQTGVTPHRWLTHERLVAAQSRLEKTGESIEQVAEAVGLQTAATLRLHFGRVMGITPTVYRRQFSTRAARR